MPQVRRYGARQGQTAALPGARISPEAGGTATAEGAGLAEQRGRTLQTLGRVGEEAAQLGVNLYARQQAEVRREAEEARQRAIQLQVIEGENQLATWERDRVHDPRSGALTVKGKEAMPLPEIIDAEFEKVAGETAKTMATPEARLAFERVIAQRRQALGLAIRRHVDREIQTYTANEVKARVDNGIDLAIRAGTTPDAQGRLDLRAAAVELRAAENAFKAQAPALGLGPEQVDEQLATIRTRVHEGIVNQLVAQGNMQAARAYFEEAGGAIDPERKDDIEKTLRAGTVKQQAQTETERILTAGGTLQEQRAKAKQIDDPDVQDEVLARIEHEAAVQQRQEAEDHRALLRGVADTLDRTRNVTAIPADQWARLDPSERSAFRSYVKQLVEKSDVDTDLRVYYGHLQAASRDPLKWAQETNLERQIDRLGKTEFKQLADLQHDILRGETKKAEQALTGYLTTNQVVTNAFAAQGFDTTPEPGTPEANRFYALQREIDRQVAAMKAATGKEPSTADVQRIADEILTNVTLQRGTWRGLFTSESFTDVQKRLGEVTIADMPAELRRQAEDSLRRNGQIVNDQTVLNLYRRYLLQQQQGAK